MTADNLLTFAGIQIDFAYWKEACSGLGYYWYMEYCRRRLKVKSHKHPLESLRSKSRLGFLQVKLQHWETYCHKEIDCMQAVVIVVLDRPKLIVGACVEGIGRMRERLQAVELYGAETEGRRHIAASAEVVP